MSHLQIIAALEELVERQAQIIRALSARLAQLGAVDTGRDEIEAADELFRRVIGCDEQPENLIRYRKTAFKQPIMSA